MRNLIGLAAALALFSLPGCSRVYGGPGVSVTFSAGYSDCNYDDYDDVDWDNAMIINDNQIGVWVMLPSGRWVLRCRSMWWDSGYDGWRFGPWWYDYSVAYGNQFPLFHWYMHRYYPRWHDNYFYRHGGNYSRRADRHFYHYDNNAPAIRHEGPHGSAKMIEPGQHHDNAREVRPNQHSDIAPMVRPQEHSEHSTIITREPSATMRTDGGERMQGRSQVSRKTEITRENPTRPDRSINRTDSRRELRGR